MLCWGPPLVALACVSDTACFRQLKSKIAKLVTNIRIVKMWWLVHKPHPVSDMSGVMLPG